MHSQRLRLFQTLPHACGYFADRTAQNIVLDPASETLAEEYTRALPLGFRRAGSHVYLPHCDGCRACVPCRVAVNEFAPTRSQRRCLARNADLRVNETAAGYNAERYALYAEYLHLRHPDGGMDPASPKDFDNFLGAPWSPTLFLEIRDGARLVALAVTDVCETGVSAVYTFFDPALGSRGLGSFAILKQIELTRRLGLDYLYLGFWIAGHPKMAYKARFAPLEVLDSLGWHRLREHHG